MHNTGNPVPVEAEQPVLLTIAFVARLLGLSPYVVKGLVDDGVLTGTSIRGIRYVVASSVQEYVKSLKETA